MLLDVEPTPTRTAYIHHQPQRILLMPDHKTLMVSTSAGGVATPGDPTTGKLYKLPIGDDGKPGALEKLWESGPREGPDGFALAASAKPSGASRGPLSYSFVSAPGLPSSPIGSV